jgi:hypothetical protein
MLHGRNAGRTVDQRSAKRSLTDILSARGNVHRLRQIDAAETNAGIHGRGLERHHHFLARMQTHASGSNRSAQRSLTDHKLQPNRYYVNKQQ